MEQKQARTMVNDLTEGSVPRRLLAFALPLMLSGVLQTAYNMVDMIIVGRFVGDAGLSAVSIGGDILHLLTFIAMGFSNAGQVVISKFVGAGEREKISHTIGTLFTFLLGAAAVLTVVCLLLSGSILHWVQTPPEAYDQARAYTLTCMAGLIFIYGYNLVSAILRGMGDSKHPLLFIAIATVINIILDLLFVGVFGMGAFGAALATVLGQAVSFLSALWILYRQKEAFGFDFRPESLGLKPDVFPKLLKLGVPMMLQSAAVSFSKLFVSSWVNSYGLTASAVSGMAAKLESVVNVVNHACSTAGASMVAQNIGARKYERVPRTLLTLLAVAGVFSAVMTVLTVLWPDQVFGIFTSGAETLAMCRTYVPVAVILYAASALRSMMMAMINGSGRPKLNLTVAILDAMVFRVGVALLLGLVFKMGVYGFWYGNAVAGMMPFFIGSVFYLSGSWKKGE